MPTMGIKKKKQFQPKSTNDGVKEPHGSGNNNASSPGNDG